MQRRIGRTVRRTESDLESVLLLFDWDLEVAPAGLDRESQRGLLRIGVTEGKPGGLFADVSVFPRPEAHLSVNGQVMQDNSVWADDRAGPGGAVGDQGKPPLGVGHSGRAGRSVFRPELDLNVGQRLAAEYD